MITIHGEPQELFDRVVRHLAQQKRRSMHPTILDADGRPICAYRGEGDTKCAVGCLISDDEYLPEIEGKGVLGVWFSFENTTSSYVLDTLQCIHDSADGDVATLKDRLYSLAKYRGLDPSAVKEITEWYG